MADEKKSDDELSGKVYDSRLIRRLGNYLRPYWIQATISTLAVICASSFAALGPFFTMVALDTYIVPGVANDFIQPGSHWLAAKLDPNPYIGITQLGELYLGALILVYFFEFVQTYLMQWTGQKLMFDLRKEIFRHMQRMHIGFYDTNAVGRLVTRLTSDVDAINEMFTAGVLAVVDDFFTLLIMAVIMLKISWWLALLSFSVLPLILIVTRLFRDSVRESYRRVRTAIARINTFTQEYITGMSVVQLFNREARAQVDFEKVNRDHMIAFKDTIFAYALYYPTVDFLSMGAIAIVIWRGGFGVLSGTVWHGPFGMHADPITVGVVAMFIQYSMRFWRPIQDLSDKYNILQSAMTACERIFKLLDTAPEIVSPVNPLKGDGSNRIEFKNVWFTYQKLTEEQKAALAAISNSANSANPASLEGIEWILKDVSFTIEPGETVAIVGHTGAGKTTLTSLMMRFYDVTAGSILIDGIDLRQHDLTELRRHFAVLLQDPFLFTGTIGENIRLGNTALTDDHLRTAAENVNVLEFINSLPARFDEPVRERGSSLSTGQKQLINFARALAYNPRILILDEATSSVDTETELRIRSALERMVQGRTSVLIAHRLSTVQRADTILVMHKGQLREQGTHQQLLAHRGLYWKLYQLQYKDQEVAA
jgi:ATP-binding cassette subfamily B protein